MAALVGEAKGEGGWRGARRHWASVIAVELASDRERGAQGDARCHEHGIMREGGDGFQRSRVRLCCGGRGPRNKSPVQIDFHYAVEHELPDGVQQGGIAAGNRNHGYRTRHVQRIQQQGHVA